MEGKISVNGHLKTTLTQVHAHMTVTELYTVGRSWEETQQGQQVYGKE